MNSLWKAEGTFWFDLFRLACHGLMLAIFLGFLGSVLPVGDSLAVFRIEFTVILAMCGIVAYLLGRSLIPLLVLITVFLSLFSLVPFVGQSDVNDPDLRLHQHNVLYGNPRMEELAVNIGKTRADVLMFQEVSEENFAILRKHLEATYPHFNVCLYSRGGVAVMMRETGALLDRGCLPKSRVSWMRVETVHGPVTVASIHQLWPWPKGQFWQIDRIARDIAALPEPVVIAGDFNSVPWSAAVRAVTRAANGKLAKGLARSFVFPTPWPQFRIDHVVVPRGAKVDARLTSGWGSDHLGVTADIAF